MPFPMIKYGRCPVCGGVGKDHPDPGDQFSTEDHAGAGYNLEYYEGRLMCNMCKKRLQGYAQTALKNSKYDERQRFWEKSGVRKHMEEEVFADFGVETDRVRNVALVQLSCEVAVRGPARNSVK